MPRRAVTAPATGSALTIGVVCRTLKDEFPDVSISKIRFLEDQQLVTPRRTSGGYRLYEPNDVERLRTILRLQRDQFLPLRVIRQELANADTPARPARRRVTSRVEARRRMSRAELADSTGATPAFVRELEEFGLIGPVRPDGAFGELEADIVRVCLQLAAFGLGPRHLKPFHTAILRAAGIIEGVVAPALRSRNPDRREAGFEDLASLAHLTGDLTERILVRSVSADA
jgi:DNA-binding transcriptional MerR regulator